MTGNSFKQLLDENAKDTAAAAHERQLLLRILLPLFLGYYISFVDRTNLGVCKLQMQAQIGLSETSFSLVGGIFYLSYSCLQVPGNQLSAHIGPRRVLGLALVASGSISVSTASVQGLVRPTLKPQDLIRPAAPHAFGPRLGTGIAAGAAHGPRPSRGAVLPGRRSAPLALVLARQAGRGERRQTT